MTDLINANKVYEEFGIPRSMLRSLVEQGIVGMVERQIDQCHAMKFYSRNDITRYIKEG